MANFSVEKSTFWAIFIDLEKQFFEVPFHSARQQKNVAFSFYCQLEMINQTTA